MVNEVYARSQLLVDMDSEEGKKEIEKLLEDLEKAIRDVINQPGVAKVKVQRWYPGVIQEIVEEVDEKSNKNISQRLLSEATSNLEKRQSIQTLATKQKTLKEILGDDYVDPEKGETKEADAGVVNIPEITPKQDITTKPRRRVRQKMRSTPVVGGGLFGETIVAKSGRDGTTRVSDFDKKKKTSNMDWSLGSSQRGIAAEISIKGEIFNIRISRDTWKDLQKGFHGQMVDSRGIEMSSMKIEASDDAPIVQRLTGFVRNMPLRSIEEEDGSHLDSLSEVSGEDLSRHSAAAPETLHC